MQTIEINVFSFDELTDDAKEKARDWYRSISEHHWVEESKQSIQAFVDHFRADLKNWRVDAGYSDYDCQYSNSHFRGMRLIDFKRDNMPTGYWLDSALWETFYDVFKSTGSVKKAFDEALHEGFKQWSKDLEFQNSDEYIDEHIQINEYKFTEDGKFFH